MTSASLHPSRQASHRPGRPKASASSPTGSSSFLGRAQELAELTKLIERCRLITLTGAPGVGKTRLARELAERHADPAAVAELAPVSDRALVHRTLASALSLSEVPGQDLWETIIAHLLRRPSLLVLDNCEHLRGACVEVVEALLFACPDLRILATSREPLRVTAETAWQVPPLSVPRPDEPPVPEQLMSYEAVNLFVERGRAVEPDFALNAYVAPALSEICRRLDGIPLAIELAAARAALLTPHEIAGRLNDRFSLLAGGRSSRPSRHQTLAAAIDWSHELLSAPERALLRRLSVFTRDFEPEACAHVCAGGDVDSEEVVELLESLVSKSLVVADVSGGRHGFLETIHAYAANRLEQSGEAPAVREAHARFYLGLAEQAEPKLSGPDETEWFECLESERSNIRSALEWSLGHGRSEWGLRLTGALVLFWRARCHFSEGRHLLEAAISANDGSSPVLVAKALWGAGFLALMAGESGSAVAQLEDSLVRFRKLQDAQGQARASLVLANAKRVSEIHDASVLSLLHESEALAREAGDSWCQTFALAEIGMEYTSHGNLAAARRAFADSVAISRETGDKLPLRFALLGLGRVALHQGEYSAAKLALTETMAVSAEAGDDYMSAAAAQDFALLAVRSGQYSRARDLLDRTLALLRKTRPAQLQLPLVARAWLARVEGEPAMCRHLLAEALTVAATSGDDPTPAILGMGELAMQDGDVRAARRYFEEALDRSRTLGTTSHVAQALDSLGELARAQGDTNRARLLAREALTLRRQSGDVPGLVASLDALAGLEACSGRPEHAALMLGAVNALREGNGYIRTPAEATRYAVDLALLRRSLSPEQLERAFANGAALSLDDAVAAASNGGGRGERPESGWSSLTEAEHKVAALVAEGLTNRGVAERLSIAPATVKRHLLHIFSKLGIARRSELAVEVSRRREQSS